MGLFDSESKKRKQDLVSLQNIVLDIDEKKLQVSEEFLEQMTKIYISRYMKTVNECLSDMSRISSISLLFRKYDTALKNLDKLMEIEPCYKYRRTPPSEYKADLEEKLDHFTNSLIAREWKKVKPSGQKVREDPMLESKVRKFFDTYTPFKPRLPQSSIELLDSLYNSAFPEEAKVGAEEAARAADAAIAGAESSDVNVFVEESFQDLSGAVTDKAE